MNVTDDIVQAVTSRYFRFSSEIDLQEQLAAAFKEDGIVLAREHRLTPKDRPDFFHVVDGVTVEVKIKGSAASVLFQLHRYAQHDSVTSIVLLTSVVYHVGVMPRTLCGKPVVVVKVGGFL